LAWILVQYLQTTYQTAATRPQVWSLVGVVIAGVVLMIVARFVLRSPFFQIPRESDSPAGESETGDLPGARRR
jgi:hypothetical protein